MFNYAGFWRRLGARFIDAIIILIVNALVFGVFTAFVYFAGKPSESVLVIAQLIFWMASSLFPILYSAYFVSDWGGTPGKRLFGLEVRQVTSERLNFWHAAGREVAMQLNSFTLGIGFIMIAARQDKRGLHDIVSRTQVIRY